MKFSEFPYQRIDMDALKKQIVSTTQKLQTAKNFQEADEAFVAMNELLGQSLMTQRTVAQIRRDVNTSDAFYDGEMAYYNRAVPELQPARKAWTDALLASHFRKELEEKYGNVTFLNAEISQKTFTPEMVPDLQRENELVTRYVKLIASAQIPFEGNAYTLAQLAPYKLDPDDTRRLAAWTAEGEWYNQHGAELDEIYDQLVKVRDAMGRKLGYDGYTQLGYYRMERNCYTAEDVAAFRAAVQKYLVPLAKKIYLRQATRMGKEFPLNFADKDLAFRSGNPKPIGTPAEILAQGAKFYQKLSPETHAFWTFMRKHEMMDVESKPGKASGGYCTCVYGMNGPFIFANFNGTAHDVKVITHEAGHAFAGFLNRSRVPADTMWPSMEGCEVHSMSMEFFAEAFAENFFGGDARKFRYTHLTDALTFIPYGAMVDHFQHIMYEYPEFTPAERHQVWQELLGVYMPWVAPGTVPFYGEGKGWQRQSHIYKTPFYYIDYCLAQTVALEFWAKIQKDPKAAFDTYLRYTQLGGSMVFTKLLKEAGLSSPFAESTLKNVCEAADKWLDAFDLSGLG